MMGEANSPPPHTHTRVCLEQSVLHRVSKLGNFTLTLSLKFSFKTKVKLVLRLEISFVTAKDFFLTLY